MTLLLALVPILLIVALVLSMRRDARGVGNAFLLTLAATAVLLALAAGTGAVGSAGASFAAPAGAGAVVLAVLSPLLLLILIGFLLAHGVARMRRDGVVAGSLVPLLSGIGVLAVGASAVAVLLSPAPGRWLLTGMAFLLMLCTWAGFVLVTFLVSTVVYASLSARAPAGYVMVHGTGLVRGEVSPQLAARLDAGIAHWRRIRGSRPDALLVVSGGRAPGARRAEAPAMAEYLREHGVPDEAIVLESASRTTEENLLRTRDLVGSRLPADVPGLSITSSYHVLRTAALAREVGLDVQVAPARAAGIFWPSAFLRETVLLLGRRWRLHTVVALLVTLPLPLVIALVPVLG